ncbi:MAG TPA: DUF551 domain-containing protein [Polyangiaceae bacterium]|jgi:hypothetical protein|nr:DUF551 domain-containing protein [Polyangiaceae bacterium]
MTRSDEELTETYDERFALRDVYTLGLSDAAPRWIAVKERLPEPQVWVWVAQFGEFCEEAVWTGERWMDYDGTAHDVTHWMPLPAPPEPTNE